MMKRYGYERRHNYQIFDRIRGITDPIAACKDEADATLLVNALNYYAETSAKRSNHNNLVPDPNSASGYRVGKAA
jgi:hypothetical protein